jgi:hypothetical protein
MPGRPARLQRRRRRSSPIKANALNVDRINPSKIMPSLAYFLTLLPETSVGGQLY